MAGVGRTVCVAPMMGLTTATARRVLALIAPRATLFTEMQRPIIDEPDVIRHVPTRGGSVCQISGHDPEHLERHARIASALGHDEINLNAGCPGRTMTSAGNGVALMRDAAHVEGLLRAMQRGAGSVPVTLKTRLGLGFEAKSDLLYGLAAACRATGVNKIYLHMRNAILDPSWSSLDNRTRPVIDVERARRATIDFPELTWILNGEIRSEADADRLSFADGVMIGRAAIEEPFLLARLTGESDDTQTRIRVARFALTVPPCEALSKMRAGFFARTPHDSKWRDSLTSQGGAQAFLDRLAPARVRRR